jgi:type I pantothenate kinase
MLDALVDDVCAVHNRRAPVVVSLAGPVGIGKTTLAESVVNALRAGGVSAQTISTDGFLRRSVELEAAGLLDRKGFPETYDVEGLLSVIAAFRAGRAVEVPVYSHATFDPDDSATLTPADVVIVEGVNALQPDTIALSDRCWYLDAPDGVVITWFLERFRALTERARTAGGFYTRFITLPADELDAVARHVWDSINQPNLDRHIRPTRDAADLVIDAVAWRGAR